MPDNLYGERGQGPGARLGGSAGVASGVPCATLGAVVPDPHPDRLRSLRSALLDLHKTLVESERVGYEQAVRPITSPTQFLRLLADYPWFLWLHPLSRLIVDIDATLDEEVPLTVVAAERLMDRTRRLLVASEEGDGFPRSYFDALQRDPDVIFAHARVAAFLRGRPAAC